MNKKILRQRVYDVFCGASGEEWGTDERWASPEELSRIIPALHAMFDPDNRLPGLWSVWNITRFMTIDDATEEVEKCLENLAIMKPLDK